jgi:hypothetical protein
MIGRHQQALTASRKPGEEPSIEESRWALLVTFEEIEGIVDEIQKDGGPVAVMESRHASAIKEGRAMLFLEGVPVLPELLPPEHAGQLNG